MLLDISGLTKSFSGLTAVNSVDQTVEKGKILGLIGPNGAGKTTLFNLISGTLPPSEGKIQFNGKNITGQKPFDICRQGIARTFQIVKPLQRMSVLDNVMVGAFCHHMKAREAKEKAMEALEFTGQVDKKDLLAKNLTLSERKKLEISRALATDPKLLLLDECMAGLNAKEIEEATALIEKIKKKGITLIVIEHVMKAIMSISDRIVVLNYGKKIMEGTPTEVVTNEEVIEAYLGGEHAQGG